MYKVIFHYEVGGIAKQLVADVFMTLAEARDYILDQFDQNVEYRNEHEDGSTLDEGHLAEICGDVIRRNYQIEYTAEV
jgi:hypothetical protein